MARANKKFPQTDYVAVKNSLQMEWQYVYHRARDEGKSFDGVEEATASKFLPSLCGAEDDNKNKYQKLAAL